MTEYIVEYNSRTCKYEVWSAVRRVLVTGSHDKAYTQCRVLNGVKE